MMRRDREGKLILSKKNYENNPLLLEAYRQGYKEGYQVGRESGWDWAVNAIETEKKRMLNFSLEMRNQFKVEIDFEL